MFVVAQFIAPRTFVYGTRRVPTTFKRIFKSELFMHTPQIIMGFTKSRSEFIL